MKVLYIHPNTLELRESQCVIPIGMVGVLNLLKSMGHEVLGISIPTSKFKNKNYNYLNDVKKIKPNIVMVDLHWAIYSYSSIEICKTIKNYNDSIITIIGGITASIYYKEIIEKFKCIDYIIRGDSEEPTKELINLLEKKDYNYCKIPNLSYRKGNKIFHNELTYTCNDISKYNYYDYDFLKDKELFFKMQGVHKNSHNDNKLAWIPIGRGCNYNCTYCGGNIKMFKDVFKRCNILKNNINSIIYNMHKLNEKYGINVFGITHDFGIFEKEFWSELLTELEKFPEKVGIQNYLFQLPPKEFIKKFIEVTDEEKTIIGIPISCGNDKIRIKNGKLFTNKELFSFLDVFVNKKTTVELYFILNLYYQDDINNIKKLIIELFSKYKNKVNLEVSCGFEIVQPYSKKSRDKVTSLTKFSDYYYRYSPKFLNNVKNGENLEYLVGEVEYDKTLVSKIKEINEVIKDYE